jgi:hypothetical protein
MALGFTALLQRNRLDEITALMDAGAGAARLRIYDGTRAATADTAIGAQVLLAELTFSTTSFPAASGTPGSMTANAITDDAAANATGTATWFRIVDDATGVVMDGDVGTSGSDLNLNSVSIAEFIRVSVSSFVLTAGNQ